MASPGIPPTVGEAVDLTAESQDLGDRLVRLSEFSSSRQLNAFQRDILTHAEPAQLESLGLTLVPEISGAVRVKARGVVGIARFVHGRNHLTVQVEPKIADADVFRMLDAAYGLESTERTVEMPTGPGLASAVFLKFFLEQVRAFLGRSHFRGYRFTEQPLTGTVKGRPMVRAYVSRHLSQLQPQVVPCRFVDFSSDVFENQVIAYALHVTTGLLDAVHGPVRDQLMRETRACTRLLPGVNITRVNARDIDSHRYSRSTEEFRPIHRLCRVVIANYQTSFKPGSRIPFTAFGIDMGSLFESYVASLLQRAFPTQVRSTKPELTFPVAPFGKEIELDALIDVDATRVVVECKYKDIADDASARDDAEWIGDKVRAADLYQTVAYSSHRSVSADHAVIVYPSWSPDASPSEISQPTTDFGWSGERKAGTPCYLLGVSLKDEQREVVQAMRETLGPLMGSRTR